MAGQRKEEFPEPRFNLITNCSDLGDGRVSGCVAVIAREGFKSIGIKCPISGRFVSITNSGGDGSSGWGVDEEGKVVLYGKRCLGKAMCSRPCNRNQMQIPTRPDYPNTALRNASEGRYGLGDLLVLAFDIKSGKNVARWLSQSGYLLKIQQRILVGNIDIQPIDELTATWRDVFPQNTIDKEQAVNGRSGYEHSGLSLNNRKPLDTHPRQSLYETLGAPVGCTPEELKKYYRNKMMQLHPDYGRASKMIDPERDEKAKKVNLAYEILSKK